MGEELATILRLVAEGKLSADEAAPIIEALTVRSERGPSGEKPAAQAARHAGEHLGGRGRRVRIQVNEQGRRVVDLRVPLAFAAVAARMVPGIPDDYASMIERAVESDMTGTIVDAEDEDGDGVLISVE